MSPVWQLARWGGLQLLRGRAGGEQLPHPRVPLVLFGMHRPRADNLYTSLHPWSMKQLRCKAASKSTYRMPSQIAVQRVSPSVRRLFNRAFVKNDKISRML